MTSPADVYELKVFSFDEYDFQYTWPIINGHPSYRYILPQILKYLIKHGNTWGGSIDINSITANLENNFRKGLEGKKPIKIKGMNYSDFVEKIIKSSRELVADFFNDHLTDDSKLKPAMVELLTTEHITT